MNSELNIKANFDRCSISSENDASHYLLINALANDGASANSMTKSPLNLALIIDRSGSMKGARLDFAKKAAAGIVEKLTKVDRISLVSFDDTASVHIDGIACDTAGRRAVMNAIQMLEPGKSTNLAEGWLKGAECLGVVMEQYSHFCNSLIILSDGHANAGTVNPVALGHDAGQLQLRGLCSSAVGIGDDYSTPQLMAIALNGGGTLHHAPRPDEIVEVVLGELDDLRERSIECLTLKVEFPVDATVELLGLSPCKFSGSQMICHMGGLLRGANRSIVLRVKAPSDLRTNALPFKITPSWRIPGSAELVTGKSLSAKLKVSSTQAGETVDIAASLEIAKLWQSYIIWKVADLNRALDYRKVEQFMSRELAELKQFCQRVPEAASVEKEIEDLAKVAFKEWDENKRKEIQHTSYMSSYSQTDKRARGSQDWKDLFKE